VTDISSADQHFRVQSAESQRYSQHSILSCLMIILEFLFWLLQWCIGGHCVPTGRNVVQPSAAGGWSDWKDGPCSSGCLVRSKGAIVGERECDKPKPSDVLHRCEGPSVRVSLCDDTDICTEKKVRQSAVEYAGQQCSKFSAVVPTIDPEASGFQADYSTSKSATLSQQKMTIN